MDSTIEQIISRVAQEKGVPAWIPLCVCNHESGGNPHAVVKDTNGVFSVGLFQLNLAGVGAGHSVEQLLDPQLNAELAIARMAPAYERFKGAGLSNLALLESVANSSGWPCELGMAWVNEHDRNYNIGLESSFQSYGPKETPVVDPELPHDTVLNEGDHGPAVAELQQDLRQEGFNPGPVDGDFGPETKQAVEELQQADGLQVDGIDGPKTEAAIAEHEHPTAEYVEVDNGKYNSFYNIAFHVYGRGDQWPALIRLNPGIDPRKLEIGQKIRVK